MTDPVKSPATFPSQVPVLVTIVGVDGLSQVYYTYTDPETGDHYVQSPTCSINAVSPYQTLFALDYPTSRNGWIIAGLATADPTTTLIPSFGTNGCLALITQEFGSLDYKFGMSFYNNYTEQVISDDPQEGNILQPIKPGTGKTD
jgi:hypothetical protein